MENMTSKLERDAINCWIVFIKPFDEPDRSNIEKVLPYQKQCIDHRIFGMGWPLDTDSILFESKLTSEIGKKYSKEYADASEKHETPSQKALSQYEKMKSGDIAIMRMMNGHYQIGRLITDTLFLHKKGSPYEELSWGCKVENWYEVVNEADVPSRIRGRFSQSHLGTVQRVADDNTKAMICSLYEAKALGKSSIPPIKLTKENFVKNLDYKELEDLVFLYMWNKHKDEEYILLPSSCKVNQPVYEFYLTNGVDDNITCQVKNQSEVPQPQRYAEDSHIRIIYVFSGLWDEKDAVEYQKSATDAGINNVKSISPSELYQTLLQYKKQFTNAYRTL